MKSPGVLAARKLRRRDGSQASPRLGYVPPPQADETVYSILAAYYRLLRIRPFASPRLYSDSGTQARADWPVGLNRLASALPPGLQLDAADLLFEHTPAPLYLPFLARKRQAALIRSILEIGFGRPDGIAGGRQRVVPNPPRLRVCPRCLKADAAAGRPYWHRVHQCAGVLVCPWHPGTVLHETSLTRSEIEQRQIHVDPGGGSILGPVAAGLSSHEWSIARRVAGSIASLLGSAPDSIEAQGLRLALREALREGGYAAARGKIAMAKLHRDFGAWFSPALESAVGIPRPSTSIRKSWLFQMLSYGRDSIAPVLLILVAVFLGRTIESLLERARHPAPQPGIKPALRNRGASPCVLRFEAAAPVIRRLWRNRHLTVTEIAGRVRVSASTVTRWAVTLKLPFPRHGPRLVRRPPGGPPLRFDFRQRAAAKRRLWLRIVKNKRTRIFAVRSHRLLYRWLSRHDHAWLSRHFPRARRRAP